MKKFLLFILLVMTLPMTMKSAEITIDGIKYEVVKKGKIATVIQNDPKYRGDIVIPASIEYEGVTCDVTSIGDKAFYDCSSLTSINIPNSVTNIGKEAFYNCNSLQKVIVSDIAAWCNISFYDYYSNPLSYAHHLYSDENTEITNLIIPEGVTSIGVRAFNDCSYLKSVNIPNSVTSIGDAAFSWCYRLESVVLGDNIKSIGSGAFGNCSSLTSIDIPNSVTSIGSSAFGHCSSLTSINIPNSVTSIEYMVFGNCSSLTSISIPNSVTSIGEWAFEGCSSLASIDIPNSVTSIGNSAFHGCEALESVVIGDGINLISSRAFHNCFKLKNITIGKEVTKIYYDNFYNCVDLEVVTCKALSSPTFYQDDYQDAQPFSGCYIQYAKLIVPDESIDAYKAANVWKDFGTIEGLSGNISEPQKCATPTISYADGQLTFECETEGVKFQTSITNPDVGSYNTNTINLGGTYYVKVYATKPEYEDSDVATIEINLLEGSGPAIKGDVDNDGYVNMMDVTKIINIILGKE